MQTEVESDVCTHCGQAIVWRSPERGWLHGDLYRQCRLVTFATPVQHHDLPTEDWREDVTAREVRTDDEGEPVATYTYTIRTLPDDPEKARIRCSCGKTSHFFATQDAEQWLEMFGGKAFPHEHRTYRPPKNF